MNTLLGLLTDKLRSRYGKKWKCPECGGRMIEQRKMVDIGYSMAKFDCISCSHTQWHTPSETLNPKSDNSI